MADEVQDPIIRAVDFLINNRLQKIDRDKTIVAKVLYASDTMTSQYKLDYNNGYIYAYGQNNTTYEDGKDVYVLVPEGNFSKKKIILGYADNITNDGNITVVSALMSDYNMIGRNVIGDPNKRLPVSLNSYRKEDYILLYQRGDEKNSLLTFNVSEFENYIKSAEALMIEASFMTRLPRAHQYAKNGTYGIQYVLAFKNGDKSEDEKTDNIKYVSYTLDSDNMSGNPMLYSKYIDQYSIFQLDADNFLYVDSIMAFSKGFVEKTDAVNAELWRDDIFVREPEIYGLRKIEAVNGDYTMRLSTPNGSTFKTLTKQEELNALARTTYKGGSDVSDATTYYWFSKDDRIDALTDGYEFHGGAGWKWLKDSGANKNFVTTGYDNRAYENKYLAVGVYKDETVMKQEFSFFNDAAKRDIEIKSDLGQKFSFDRGVPKLTCYVNGKESNFEDSHKDSLFSFSWSVKDQDGTVVAINKTKEELQKAYDDGIKNQIGYSALSALKSQITAMEGVTFDKNHLTYPVKKIVTQATFSCSVYLKENDTAENFYIGSASILLQNTNAAVPQDYYIIIENGNQVFQYSEMGVSPTSDRLADPQVIDPLSCHFYDPAGLEVNNKTYDVKWKVPLSNTLIKMPTTSMEVNTANNKLEYYNQETYPLAIKDPFDYNAVENQVTCIVSYGGQEYQQDSDLTFVKVGDNGTNGTDLVAKIVPVKSPGNNQLAAIELSHNASPKWNNGVSISAQALKFELFNKGDLINPESAVTWSVAGTANQSRFLSVTDGIVSYADSTKGDYNFVVKARTLATIQQGVDAEGVDNKGKTVKTTKAAVQQEYFAFYPVPIINYNNNVDYKVALDKTYCLKQILYNSDGRNPLYNKNQGVFFDLLNESDGKKYTGKKKIVFTVQGGINNSSSTSAFDLKLRMNDSKAAETNSITLTETLVETYRKAQAQNTTSPGTGLSQEALEYFERLAKEYPQFTNEFVNAVGDYAATDRKDGTEDTAAKSDKSVQANDDFPQYGVYISPNDAYDGAYNNNMVIIKIYSPDAADKNPETVIYFPIHMSLNTYGLASLNSWDGNHIEINEDGNYILAPQVGAGQKEQDNTFSGIVMGTARTYDQKADSVGLLGYSHGKQSIWLDSITGKAVFGLPEQQASQSNHYNEGRIELIPGGESKIGMWTIGSRGIYNITKPDEEDSENKFVGVPAEDLPKPYTDYPVKDAYMSIPVDAQGILLSANPSYLSIKSKPLNEKNSTIDWGGANTAITKNDSLEVELDPHKQSVFSIYRHTRKGKAKPVNPKPGETWDYDPKIIKDTDKWERYPLVGINANGQFYTNAIKDGESSMGIGKIGAFRHPAADDKYIGAQFAYGSDAGSKNILKFFIDNPNNLDEQEQGKSYTREDAPLYLTAGSTVDYTDSNGKTQEGNEYPRRMSLLGKEIHLYAADGMKGRNKKTSPHKLVISQDTVTLGHEKTYLLFPNASTSTATIQTDANFSLKMPDIRSATIELGTTNFTNFKTMISKFNSKGSAQDVAINSTIIGQVKVQEFSSLLLQASEESNKGRLRIQSDRVSLGGDDAFVSLSHSLPAELHSNYGVNITGQSGPVNIITSKAAQGITLDASFQAAGNSNTSTSRLKLIADTSGTGLFTLAAGDIQVYSNREIPLRPYVQLTPGMTTPWGHFTSSIEVGSKVMDQGWFDTIQHFYDGNNFSKNWLTDYEFHGWMRSNWGNNLDTRIDKEASTRAEADGNLSTRITAAQNTADKKTTLEAVQKWVNEELQKYVTKDKFNLHNHKISEVRSNHQFTDNGGDPKHNHGFDLPTVTEGPGTKL